MKCCRLPSWLGNLFLVMMTAGRAPHRGVGIWLSRSMVQTMSRLKWTMPRRPWPSIQTCLIWSCSGAAKEPPGASWVKELRPDRVKHFGIMVRDDAQINEVREKITKKYGLSVEPHFRCDFRDPWGNRIQVGDLHDESLVWLLPYREVQTAGIQFDAEGLPAR